MTKEEREKTIATAIDVFEYQIKRSEDVKCHKCDECGENPFEDYCIKDVAKWLSLALEALKQEPKTGHWILDETDNSITCDKCGCLIWANDISNGEANYCPSCGAKMEVKE